MFIYKEKVKKKMLLYFKQLKKMEIFKIKFKYKLLKDFSFL